MTFDFHDSSPVHLVEAFLAGDNRTGGEEHTVPGIRERRVCCYVCDDTIAIMLFFHGWRLSTTIGMSGDTSSRCA